MNDIYDQKHKIAMEILKNKRVEAKLTQKELAAKLGCAQSYISKYEAGQVRLGIIEVRNICDQIGISLEDYVKCLENDIKAM